MLLHIITILLTLGSPPECDGFGMCLIENHSETAQAECMKYENCIEATMDYTDKTLSLIVSQSKIKDKAFIKYFTKETFEVEKTYTLSEDVASSLGCPIGTFIPTGKYPISEENGKIVVRIKVH